MTGDVDGHESRTELLQGLLHSHGAAKGPDEALEIYHSHADVEARHSERKILISCLLTDLS